MAIEFDIREPKNQRLIAMFLIPIVILYAFFHFIIKTKLDELTTKENQLIEIQNRIESTQRTLLSNGELEETKEKLMVKFDELNSLLPEKENVAMLLDQFSKVEMDSKVFLVGFEATETIEGDDKPYRENKYRITLEAGYHQFATFMSKVMSLQRLLSFSDLRIELNPMVSLESGTYEGLESQPRYLSIEFTLTSYIFNKLDDGFSE